MSCLEDNFFKVPEWKSLTSAERKTLSKVGFQRCYQPGETIFHQNNKCRGIYSILEGLVSVRMKGLDGKSVTLQLARRGDLLGIRPFLAQQSHLASAEVLEECSVKFLPARHIKRILFENVNFCLALLRRETREQGDIEVRFLQAATQTVPYRLLSLLLELRKHYGRLLPNGHLQLDLPISQQEMASMMGIRFETLSRGIHHLQDRGFVDCCGRRGTFLMDLPAIEQELSSPP